MVIARYYTNQNPDILKNTRDCPIPENFESIVDRYPHNLAVKVGDSQFTYDALNRLANQVARVIQSHQEGNGKPIAILMQKSCQLIAGMMGILKSGNIYVPLAPSDPPARIKTILEDSGASLILTDNDTIQLVESLITPGMITINTDTIPPDVDDEDLSLLIDPDSLAFIIYTSGSSGKPKGVTQTHRNIQHYVYNYADFINVNPVDRLTMISPFSHSAVVMDIFSALLYGASLFPYDVPSNGIHALKDWLLNEEISIYHSVPTLFRAFTDLQDGFEKFPCIRVVDLGGEIAYNTDLEAFRRIFSEHCVFANGMGSTELTVIFRCFFPKEYKNEDRVLPVGFPVLGVEFKVLDEHGNDVGIGQIGEIIYSSPALSPGYWNLPELNAKVFRSLPDHPGSRWFFSGDLGRRNLDGSLTFLERKDLQIKIRGNRVELAEVEKCILEYDGVKQAVVVDQKHPQAGIALAAFIIPDAGKSIKKEALRDFISSKLPPYMIPDRFFFVERLPSTASGKLDRNSLRTMKLDERTSHDIKRNARPGLESELLKIWKHILDNSEVGVEDDFFEIGGNSLIALRLVYEIRRRTGLIFPLSAIFDALTIEKMAEYLNQSPGERSWNVLNLVKPNGNKIPLFMISPTVIDLITYRNLADHLDKEQPLFALHPLAWRTFRAINPEENEFVDRFVKEIKKIQPTGPYFLGGFSAAGRAALRVVHQLEEQGDEIGFVFMIDTFGPSYPKLLPLVTPKLFNFLKVVRRTESYIWKFLSMDRAGKRDLILSGETPFLTKVSRWFGKRVGEVHDASSEELPQPVKAKDAFPFYEVKSPVTLMRARRGLLGVKRDHSLGWRKVFGDRLTIIDVPGDHESILFGPNVPNISKIIQELIDKATK